MLRLPCALLAAVVFGFVCVPAMAEKRVALIVGNAAYVHAGKLANPANDASDMAAALAEAGFETILGLDLDKRGFDLKIRDFARKLEGVGVGLFFYAGHAMQMSGQNYLLPVDAKLENERDLDFETVRLEFVLRQMGLTREDKTNLVFLDACRDNPLARTLARSLKTRSASIGTGLAQTKAGSGTFIAYSTEPENVALDGQSRNSPFTGALLKRVKEPGRSLAAIMIDVRNDVLAATGRKQTPWDHSALTADFYFYPTAAPQALPKPAPPASDSDMAALQEKLRRLEEALKRKSDAETTAAVVQLAQFKERLRRLDEENRADRQQLWDVQRAVAFETDRSRKDQMNREVSRIHLRMAQRGQEQKNLRTQIEQLEKAAGR
ncbi:MAG: caspase family protein [Hyphomicrobiaceae bacterium]